MRVAFADTNFEDQVIKASATVPVLVDFHADWCGPCKMIDPILDELSNDYSGQLMVGSLDVDMNQQTAAKYGVMSIPTLIFFKNGQPVKQSVGYQDKVTLQKQIEGVLGN